MDQGYNTVTVPDQKIIEGTITDPCYLMAMDAFDTYYNIMRSRGICPWPARTYGNNRYWKNFYTIGKICKENGWIPSDYVKLALDLLRKEYRYITPKDLIRDNIINNYKNRINESLSVRDPSFDWNYFIEELLSFIGPDNTEESILLSPMTGFPAWFRVVYPEMFNEEIFNLYGDEAIKEIKSNKRLLKFLKEQVPKRIEELEKRCGKLDGVLGDI